jgi:hypothetical protein
MFTIDTFNLGSPLGEKSGLTSPHSPTQPSLSTTKPMPSRIFISLGVVYRRTKRRLAAVRRVQNSPSTKIL